MNKQEQEEALSWIDLLVSYLYDRPFREVDATIHGAKDFLERVRG